MRERCEKGNGMRMRWMVCSLGLLMLVPGCAGSNRAEVPIFLTRPMRPYHIIGYITVRGGESEARQDARAIRADALILVNVNPVPEQSAPPPSIHMVGGGTIKVGGTPVDPGIHRQTYMAIQWLPAVQN